MHDAPHTHDDQPANRVVGHRGVIITIDGPAGTGKSSVALALANTLGLEFLDTGAMYRAAALIAIEHRIDLDNHNALARAVKDADIRFDWSATPPTLLVSARPQTTRLRDHDVSSLVSPVSEIPAVRTVLVERQRRIGEAHPRLVSEGRDQGSVVFYNADVKFFLDASIDIRAERRVAQLHAMGRDADPDRVRLGIADRDRRDSTRAVAPLRCPEGADRVLTDRMSQDQVVEHLAAIVRDRVHPDKLAHAATLA